MLPTSYHAQRGEPMSQESIRRRSRAGCTSCRRKHRKCDEQRPACIPCRARGLKCDYQRPLKWASIGISNSSDLSHLQEPRNSSGGSSTSSTARRNPTSPSRIQMYPVSDLTDRRADTVKSLQRPAGGGISDLSLLTSQSQHPEPVALFPSSFVLPGLDSQPQEAAYPPHADISQGKLGDISKETQVEVHPRGNENDHHDNGDDNDDPEFIEIPDESTQGFDSPEEPSSPEDSSQWVIDSTLGNFFSQIFQNPGDEIAFAYYFKRVCSCTPAHDSSQNPYRKLALMALSYPVLLHGILSVSAAHMDMYGRSNESILSLRQSQALKSLRTALNLLQGSDGRNKDTNQKAEYLPEADGIFSLLSAKEIALAAIMMQTSSVLMTDITNVDMHMTCALHLIRDLGYLDRPPSSTFTRTLIHRFAMVDVVLALTRFRQPQAPLNFYMYQDHEEVDREEPSFREMHGCHQRVLSFLAQISVLSADLIHTRTSQSEIQAKAYNLETEMRIWGRQYYETIATNSPSSTSLATSPPRRPSARAALDVVCECFYWTAHILLLRRVFLDPTKSARVQIIRKHLFRLMGSIVAGCGPDSSLPFPFYMAAREATSLEERDWVRRKHTEMYDVYRDRARISLMASVERIWENASTGVTPVFDDTLVWNRPNERFILEMDKDARYFLF